MKIRNGLEGVGAALLLLMPYYSKFLLPSNLEIYHLHLPVTNLIGGLLIDLLAYSIMTTGFLIAIQYLPLIPQRILAALFAAFMLWTALDFTGMMLIHLQHRIEFLSRVWENCAIGILLLSGVLACCFPRWTQQATRVIRLSVAAVAFSALWIVPQLLHLLLAQQPGQQGTPTHLSDNQPSDSNPRIIWILFDELSYDQTFDHPAPGIQLPNFERLRAGSVSFSALKPAGFYTDRIIPSLFSGHRVDQIRSTINGDLRYEDEAQRQWFAYDPNTTLFALAQRNGSNTAIDGWFNPYCRILAPFVDRCSWEANLTPYEQFGASEQKSALANAAVMPSRFRGLFFLTTTPQEEQIQIYRNIMANAGAMIDDRRLRFIFIHIPVPHGPGIFDRRSHQLRSGGTYLDSLVLADDTLGALMKEIAATENAGHTTMIVSSDHSWRIVLSRHSEVWSEEEERACGGAFDDRPVLLIHFPNQQTGLDVSAPLPEMLEHDMIEQMLLGKIDKSEDMGTFISQQGR
jgi:hypothetical protein